jgi:predicted DNA binding CopG/RHH family protein
MAITPSPGRPGVKPKTEEEFIAGAAPVDRDDSATEQTTFRFTRKLLRQIDQAAEERGLSRAGFVRMILTQAVKSPIS